MTTIAYDGKVLAVDSQTSANDMRIGSAQKIIHLADGRLLAFAGSCSCVPEIVSWLNGGEKPTLFENESADGIIVSLDGSAVEINKNLRMYPACVPWSGGSGWIIALVAMRCGKTAFEAIEIACEMDNGSGLPVRHVTL